MTNQVIPEAAVEAAALVLYFDDISAEFPAEHPESREACLRAARKVLEAAGPHIWEQGAEAGCIYGVEARNPYRSAK